MDVDWTTIAQLASALGTLAMLAVWAFYAKVFYDTYRERRRPWFLLHQLGGSGLSSHCLLVNMSELVAHIECVLAVVHGPERSVARRLPSYSWVSPRDEAPPASLNAFREGPLGSGNLISLGTFEELFGEMMADEAGGMSSGAASLYESIEAVEIRVITVSPADEWLPMGAFRRYTVNDDGDGGAIIKPEEFYTRQLRKGDERKRARRWLEQASNNDGTSHRWEVER